MSVKPRADQHADNAKNINAQRSVGDNATAFATTILGNGKEIAVGAYDATTDAAKGVWGVVSDYDAHDANQRTQERITALANSAAYVASGEVVIDGVTYGKYLLDNPNLIVMTAEDTADATTVVASVILVPKVVQGGTKAASASTKIVTENIGVWKAGQAVKAAEKATVDAARVENNFYGEGASSNPAGLQTSNGSIIPANPNKTTTVLGTYVADTNSIINNQIKMPKSNDFSSGEFKHEVQRC